jgi:hypothetical protein
MICQSLSPIMDAFSVLFFFLIMLDLTVVIVTGSCLNLAQG